MKINVISSNRKLIVLFVAGLVLFSISLGTTTFALRTNNYQIENVFDHVLEKPFIFDLTPHEPIEINNNGNFSDYSFSGSGTAEDPYIIEGYYIKTTSGKGIYITGTTKYFLIRNCYIDAVYFGVYINNVAEGTTTIINNTCTNHNYGNGIYLDTSSGSTLTNNTCTNNNDDGIYLRSSSGATLTNNTCTNNSDNGIYLIDSSGSTLTNNTCTNNNDDGIHMYSSSGSTLTSNTCDNNDNGIYLFEYSSDSCLTYNFLRENEKYGIIIRGGEHRASDNNIIHHNNFVDNNLEATGQAGSQARDQGKNNTWYNTVTKEGNYWSDWDGIGAYRIYSYGDVLDMYPLDAEGTPYFDITPPVIDHPANISCEQDPFYPCHTITWSPEDLHPSSYKIFKDETLLRGGIWYGDSISVGVSCLETGTYDYVCTVYDLYNNSISDTVTVIITESTAEKTRFETLIVPLALVIATIPLSLRFRRKNRMK